MDLANKLNKQLSGKIETIVARREILIRILVKYIFYVLHTKI